MVSFAMATTSSSVSNRKSGASRPKVSSVVTSIILGDIGQDGRLEEGSAKRMAFATKGYDGTFGGRVGDMFLDLFDGIFIDQRAELYGSDSPSPTLVFATAAAGFSAKES